MRCFESSKPLYKIGGQQRPDSLSAVCSIWWDAPLWRLWQTMPTTASPLPHPLLQLQEDTSKSLLKTIIIAMRASHDFKKESLIMVKLRQEIIAKKV